MRGFVNGFFGENVFLMLSVGVSIIASGLGMVGIAMADTDYERLNYFADKIVQKMPSTWNLVQKKMDVIPDGHYDGMQYKGPKGLWITLTGDRTVFFIGKAKMDIGIKSLLRKRLSKYG